MTGLPLPSDQQAVLDVLGLHRGRQHGIRGRDLARELNLRHRLCRELIEALVTEHAIPIGADPIHGYYLISAPDEFRAAQRELTTRLQALGKRLRALRRAEQRTVKPALPLFEQEAA